MPAALERHEYIEAVGRAGERLVVEAERAGIDAPVPTCPAWTVAHLVAHQTMVHRWATANVRGTDPADVPSQTVIRTTIDDLPGYYREGLGGLLAALRDAPDDLRADTFLNDAPPPAIFWARRQAHETTIHLADAIAARVGTLPTAADVDVAPTFAADGLDELLRGFFTRGRSKLFDGTALTVLVAPDDVDRRWVVHVDEQLTVEPGDGATDGPAADVEVRGPAAAIYLALWNRGDEASVTGRRDMLDRWRETQRVRWS